MCFEAEDELREWFDGERREKIIVMYLSLCLKSHAVSSNTLV